MIFSRTTMVLGALAGLSLGLALWLNLQQEGPPPADPERGQPLLPGFAELAAPAVEIRLANGEVRTTLQKGDAGWIVIEKGGYPAAGRKVAALLDGLGRAAKVAPKAADPARFSRMGLGGAGTTVSLYGEGGAHLFSLELGHQFPEPASGTLLTYAWFDGLARPWTVSGLPPIDPDPMFWAERGVLSLSPARIKRVRVGFGDRQGVALSRAEASGLLFAARELEGEAVNQAAVNALAFALSEVDAEDVAKADALDLFEVASAVFTTFDGLELTARFFDSDGVVWASFAAVYKPGVLEEADTPNVLPDVPPDTGAEAEALNRRHAGWVFRLPLQKVSAILKEKDALRADAR